MKPYMEDPLKREREGVHLIISGTDTGHLCVLDMDKGDVQCVVKVKEREGGGEGERGGSERGGTYVVTYRIIVYLLHFECYLDHVNMCITF